MRSSEMKQAVVEQAVEQTAAKNTVANKTVSKRDAELLDIRVALNPCDSERMPFDFTINPYRGCAFACRYCYARYTHEWLGLNGAEEFDKRVLVKKNFAAVLERDLARMRGTKRATRPTIAIGTATDPYQPLEHRYGLTRQALELLAEESGQGLSGLKVSITTKSDLVVRDIPILKRIAANNCLRVHLSLTTLDRDLARKLEPGAPSPRTRISAIATLARAGIAVDAFVMPIIMGLTDSEENLDALFGALAAAGVRTAVCEALFLRAPTRDVFFEFLNEELPDAAPLLEQRYHGNVYAPPIFVERLQARVRRLRRKWQLLGPLKTIDPARAVTRESAREASYGSSPAHSPLRYRGHSLQSSSKSKLGDVRPTGGVRSRETRVPSSSIPSRRTPRPPREDAPGTRQLGFGFGEESQE